MFMRAYICLSITLYQSMYVVCVRMYIKFYVFVCMCAHLSLSLSLIYMFICVCTWMNVYMWHVHTYVWCLLAVDVRVWVLFMVTEYSLSSTQCFWVSACYETRQSKEMYTGSYGWHVPPLPRSNMYVYKKNMQNRHAIIIIIVICNNAQLFKCVMLLLTMCIY